MTTLQLRRYWFEPGHLAEFVAWFPSLLPVREQYGFRVLFALGDREQETFTWAVAYEGDPAEFKDAEAAYSASTERATVFETFPGHIAKKEIGFVDDVLAP